MLKRCRRSIPTSPAGRGTVGKTGRKTPAEPRQNYGKTSIKPTRKVTPVIESRTWMCLICGWIYDEATGDAEHGLAPGTKWDAVPMNWTCPECGARKEDFEMVQL